MSRPWRKSKEGGPLLAGLFGLLALLGTAASPAWGAATLVLSVVDAPGVGFNDSTPFTPSGGNAAATLGEARLEALKLAAAVWAQNLTSDVPIRVEVWFEDLGGSPTFATLGEGGPVASFRDFTGAPLPQTWYPGALADRLAGMDLAPGEADVQLRFNLAVEGSVALGTSRFYYGFDPPPTDQVSFFSVALHELAHGLGLVTPVDPLTGAKLLGFDDAFLVHLERQGATPPDFPSMTDAQRLAAMTAGPDVHWAGPSLSAAAAGLTAGVVGGRVVMYAPSQESTEQSLTHFDTSVFPDDLLEPFYTDSADPSLTLALLTDLGWGPAPDCQMVATSGAPSGPADVLWVDDAVPAGARAIAAEDGWNWVSTNPVPFSGTLHHRSALRAGAHQHYFDSATARLAVGPGDKLFAHAYLDPANPPREVVLQWFAGNWEHRAYWGENLLPWGVDGTVARHFAGPLPALGEWVRLEVPAAAVGVEKQLLTGMAFSAYDGLVSWDRAGLAPGVSELIWVEDAVPAGATPVAAEDGWSWISSGPLPFSGSLAHQAPIRTGAHQHYFQNASDKLAVNSGDVLFAYVYLDPIAPPRQVILQWNNGSWEHRAYWGENLVPWGVNGTASRRFMGPLPPLGQWVRLEVPVDDVGVGGSLLTGMAFSLYDGSATWDRAGVLHPAATGTP